jgi:hypothetical protein
MVTDPIKNIVTNPARPAPRPPLLRSQKAFKRKDWRTFGHHAVGSKEPVKAPLHLMSWVRAGFLPTIAFVR